MNASAATWEREVREFVLRGPLHNARSEDSAIAARFEPDADVFWDVGGGRSVKGGVADFLAMIAMAEVTDPPPDPDARLVDLTVFQDAPPRAEALVHATGRDGRRVKLHYRLVRREDAWRIVRLAGGYVDKG